MIIRKIENENPLLILIHGGNSSESEWDDVINDLSKNYSLWIPTLSGHGQDEGPYTSIYDNASSLLEEAKKHYVHAKVIARGLGAQVAIRMMEYDKDFLTHVILESPLCIKTGLLKWMLLFNAKISYEPKEGQMEKKKFISMLKDNSSFILQQSIVEFNGEVLIMYASGEDKLISKSASYLDEYLMHSKILSLPYQHNMGLSHRDELLSYWLKFLRDEPLDEDDENKNEEENVDINEENIDEDKKGEE